MERREFLRHAALGVAGAVVAPEVLVRAASGGQGGVASIVECGPSLAGVKRVSAADVDAIWRRVQGELVEAVMSQTPESDFFQAMNEKGPPGPVAGRSLVFPVRS